MKKKLFIVSVVVNIICLIIIVFLDIRFHNYIKETESSNNFKEQQNQVVFNSKSYHCESEVKNDGVDTYTYTHNYEFTFYEDNITYSKYYIKAVFKDYDIFKNFTASIAGKDREVKEKHDVDNLTKYYDFGTTYPYKASSLDEYVKEVEEKFGMTCKSVPSGALIYF